MVHEENEQDSRTLFCGNLSDNVTECLLYELFLQGGPVERISIPKKDGKQCSFGFVTYSHVCSVAYAVELFAGTQLFGRELRINARGGGNTNNRGPPPMHQQPFYTPPNDQSHRAARPLSSNHTDLPMTNPFNIQSASSLRTGFHDNQNVTSMDMRPSRGHRNADLTHNQLMDINQLMQMGSKMMSSGNNFNSSGRESGHSRGGNHDYDNHNSRRQQNDQNTAHPYRRNHSPRSSHNQQRSNNDRDQQQHNHNRHQSSGRKRR